jgi:hypothetical protein
MVKAATFDIVSDVLFSTKADAKDTLSGEQVGAAGDAHFRGVAEQFIEGIHAGCHGNRRNAISVSGAYVGGCVSNYTDGSFGAAKASRLLDAVSDHLVALLDRSREGPERKVIAQTASPQFGPADALEISRGDSEQLAGPAEKLDDLRDSGTDHRTQVGSIPLHLGTHCLHNLRQTSAPDLLGHACSFQVSSQNADVRVSLNGNVVEPQLKPEHSGYGMMKRVIVDSVAAVEQRAIDVE